jgi:hypothetical protein
MSLRDPEINRREAEDAEKRRGGGKIIDGKIMGNLILADLAFSFFMGGSFHADANKIRAKFGDIRCRKS